MKDDSVMEHFIYQHGDRPLEGYTIQRAAGRGGFGEVYYATSDSGREVALKVVNNYETIELRGITQCMNLKSPHLVSIFDVKYNETNKPFVVMEYVSGPSLRDLLDQSPSGLGEQKSAFFLREIAKGLSYLHECGIVHRDLKPGNIFYENGYVKIGDYGLSKAIKQGYNSNQTITVGTVHYMAPEIGAGNYDSSIDIYALGCMLYEMLTGNVPYFGNSPGEVLMKHVSAEPDLTGLDETFARVIRKSMAKDPGERYTSVQEMIEDAFGHDHIKNSVSQFRAEDLSMIAGQVAQKIKDRQDKQTRNKPDNKQGPAKPKNAFPKEPQVSPEQPQIGPEVFSPELNYRLKLKKYDKMTPLGRFFAGLIPIALMTIAFAFAISGQAPGRYGISDGPDKSLLVFCLAIMQLGALAGISIANRLIIPNTDDPVLKGFSRASLALLFANIFIFPAYFDAFGLQVLGLPSCSLLMLAFMEKHNWLSPTRNKQIGIGHTIGMVFGVIFVSFILSRIFGLYLEPIQLFFSVCILAGVSLSCQMLAPFVEPTDREAFGVDDTNYVKLRKNRFHHDSKGQVLQPDWLKGIWRAISGLLLSLTILLIFIGVNSRGNDVNLAMSYAAGSFILFLASLRPSIKKYYIGLGSNLIKPLILMISYASAHIGFLGLIIMNEGDFLLFAIPGMLVFWIFLFMPARIFDSAADKSGQVFGGHRAGNRNGYPQQKLMPKPDWLKAVWFSVSSILFTVMITFYIAIAFSGEEELCISLGIAANILFVYSLIPALSSFYKGLGRSLIKPALLMILYALAHLGYTIVAVGNAEEFTAMAVPATILFWVVMFMPGRIFDSAAEKSARLAATAFKKSKIADNSNMSPYKRGVSLILCLVPLLTGGFLAGLHRFYVGKIGSGILWFFTGGLFGIGQLVDFIMILSGSFTDKNDKPLQIWWDEQPYVNQPVNAVNNNGYDQDGYDYDQDEYDYDEEYGYDVNGVTNEVKNAVNDVKDSIRSVAAAAKTTAASLKKKVNDPGSVDERDQNDSYFRNSNHSSYREPIRPGAALLRVIGFVFLALSMTAAFVWAARLTTIVSALPEIAHDIESDSGPFIWMYADRLFVIVMITAMLLSMLFTSLGRKHKNGWHILRGIFSIGMVILIANNWQAITNSKLNNMLPGFNPSGQIPNDALNLFFNSLPTGEGLAFAIILAVISIILFAWPASKHQPQQFENIFRGNDMPGN